MKSITSWAIAVIIFGFAPVCLAAIPQPPQSLTSWAMPWGDDVPGAVAADSLLEGPAGKSEPIDRTQRLIVSPVS
jgi:hypothetical protein